MSPLTQPPLQPWRWIKNSVLTMQWYHVKILILAQCHTFVNIKRYYIFRLHKIWIIINLKMTWIDWFRHQKICQERKDDIREWPQVEHGNIYNHWILSRAWRRRNEKIQIDGQLWFVSSGSVGKIHQFAIKNGFVLKSKQDAPVTKINLKLSQ